MMLFLFETESFVRLFSPDYADYMSFKNPPFKLFEGGSESVLSKAAQGFCYCHCIGNRNKTGQFFSIPEGVSPAGQTASDIYGRDTYI